MVLVVLGDVVGVAYVEMSCHVLAQVQIRVLGLGLDNKYFFTEKLFPRFGLSGCVSPKHEFQSSLATFGALQGGKGLWFATLSC